MFTIYRNLSEKPQAKESVFKKSCNLRWNFNWKFRRILRQSFMDFSNFRQKPQADFRNNKQ